MHPRLVLPRAARMASGIMEQAGRPRAGPSWPMPAARAASATRMICRGVPRTSTTSRAAGAAARNATATGAARSPSSSDSFAAACLAFMAHSSGGARADGEGDAHLVADRVQGGLIDDAVVTAVDDELAGGHQRHLGEVHL